MILAASRSCFNLHIKIIWQLQILINQIVLRIIAFVDFVPSSRISDPVILSVKRGRQNRLDSTNQIIVLYILILTFLTAEEKTKGSGLNGSKHYPSSSK
jgi:hypothetical protein